MDSVNPEFLPPYCDQRGDLLLRLVIFGVSDRIGFRRAIGLSLFAPESNPRRVSVADSTITQVFPVQGAVVCVVGRNGALDRVRRKKLFRSFSR